MNKHDSITKVAIELAEIEACVTCPLFEECDNPEGRCYKKTLAKSREFKRIKQTGG